MDVFSRDEKLGLILVAVMVVTVAVPLAFRCNRRWAIGIVGGLLACGTLLMVTLVGTLSLDFGGMPSLAKLPPPTVPGAPQAPSAVVASDADLLAVAASEPKIQLDGADPDPTAELESFINLDEVEPDADRPEWLDGAPEGRQKLFTDGPFATGGPHSVPSEYYAWVWDQVAVRQPDLGPTPPEWWGSALEQIRERTVVETYTERRETSVGTVYLHHTLGQVDDDDRDWLAERAEAWLAKSRRERSVQRVALGGGALLAGVAVLHGFLRSSRPKKGEP